MQEIKLYTLLTKLVSLTKWNKKMFFWRDLILLNTYECLYELEIFNRNTSDLKFDIERDFVKFKKDLALDLITSEPINQQLTGSFIYSSKYGFGKVRRILKEGFFEFYSPHYSYDWKKDNYGIYRDIFIGKNLKVFKNKILSETSESII